MTRQNLLRGGAVRLASSPKGGGIAAGLLGAWALMGPGPSSGLAAASLPDYGFLQVTVQPYGNGMFEPSIAADGTRVAFRSSANLDGPNLGGNFEIFLHDRQAGTTTQLTETPSGFGNFTPFITPDGKRVIFRSLFDFTGEGAGGTFRLWEVNVETGAFRKVTANPSGKPILEARLSGDGRFAAVVSRMNPTGQNPDGSEEVFRIDVETGVAIQISSNPGLAASNPDINGDGSRIVWVDRTDYDGSNPNGGLEVWMWREGQGVVHVTSQNLSTLETNLPRIDHAGRYVAFVSLFDFSGQGVLGRKVFLADTERGTLTLLTNPGVGGTGLNYPDAAIAPDGSAVYFESNKDLVGLNSDQNRELFAYNVGEGVLEQVTLTTGGYSISQLADDAKRRYLAVSANNAIAYRSEQDLDPDVVNGLANLDMFVTFGFRVVCLGDLDGNQEVDGGDLGLLLSNWDGDGLGDLNGDGWVDGADVGLLLAGWGACG